MVSTRKLNQNASEMDRMRVRQETIGSGRPVLDMLEEMLHHLGPDHSLPDLPEKYEEFAGMGLYGNLSGFSLVIFHPYGMVTENAYYESATDRSNIRPPGRTHFCCQFLLEKPWLSIFIFLALKNCKRQH